MPAATETQQSQPLTPEEQERRLSELLDQVVEKRAAEHLSMDAMMGLPTAIDGEAGWYYQSPKIADVRRIAELLSLLSRMVPDSYDALIGMLDGYAKVAQSLVRVRDGEGWRPPTIGEIQDRYDLPGLRNLLHSIMRGDRLIEEDSEGNANPPRPPQTPLS